ncbi:MAG: OmpH family outer membrane protein [Polaribacter sp.]|nr:OmpH family outer membrane protein [Polaribacter sp.]
MKLKFTLLLATALVCFNLNAQTKLGTIDADLIIGKMPEMTQVLERTKKYGTKLDSAFQVKVNLYQAKIDAYKKAEKTASDADKKTTSQEIFTLEEDINKYKQNGTQLMQLKRDELMRPLYKKLSDIISVVAKEKGYAQVLTTSGNQFAYIDEKHDITQLVLDALDIK